MPLGLAMEMGQRVPSTATIAAPIVATVNAASAVDPNVMAATAAGAHAVKTVADAEFAWRAPLSAPTITATPLIASLRRNHGSRHHCYLHRVHRRSHRLTHRQCPPHALRGRLLPIPSPCPPRLSPKRIRPCRCRKTWHSSSLAAGIGSISYIRSHNKSG